MTKKRRKPRKFSEADKLRIVRRIREEGQTVADVSKDLDIDTRQLQRWIRIFDAGGPTCFSPVDPAKKQDMLFITRLLKDMYINKLTLEATAVKHGVTMGNVQYWRDKYINIISSESCQEEMKKGKVKTNSEEIDELIDFNKKLEEQNNRVFDTPEEHIKFLQAQVDWLKKSIVLSQKDGHLFWSRKRK